MSNQLLKPLLICVLLLTLTVSCFAQFPFAILHGAKPKGNIDSIITPQDFGGTNISIFNTKGQLIKVYQTPFIERNNYFGRVIDTVIITYHYNEDGHLLKSIREYKGKSKGIGTSNYQYFDSDTGLIIKVVNGEEIQIDHSGRIVQTKYFPIARLGGVTKYKYNKKGYVTEEIICDTAGIKQYSFFYEYYANGNLKRTIRNNGRVTFKFTYPKYDKTGNWLVQNVYNKLGLLDSVKRRITYYK